MDNHAIRAGWPFDRQAYTSALAEIEAGPQHPDAAGLKRDRPGGIPGRKDHGPRRTEETVKEDTWAGQTRTVQPAPDPPRLDGVSPPEERQPVMDVNVPSGNPTALARRYIPSWTRTRNGPSTVRERFLHAPQPPCPWTRLQRRRRRRAPRGRTGPATLFAGAARVWMQHGALHRAGAPGNGAQTTARRPGAGTAAGSSPGHRTRTSGAIYWGNS